MSTQLPINWDASTTARLKRAVSQLKRSNLPNVPKDYRQIKAAIYSKSDLLDFEIMARASARPNKTSTTKLEVRYSAAAETVQRAQTRIINRKRAREAERLGIDMNISDERIPISERQKAFMPKQQTRAQDYYTQKGYEEHLQNVMRQSMAGYYEESYKRYKENYKMAMKNAGFTDYDRQFLSYYIDKLSDFDFFRITFDNDLFNIQYVYRDGSYNMKVEMIASQLQAELDRQGKKYKEFIPEDYGL